MIFPLPPRQKYTGYERDAETGLNFAEARYHSDVQGRFTSVDPLSASAKLTDPQSLNRYAYVGNNPVNFSDPSGMSRGPGSISPRNFDIAANSGYADPGVLEEEEARYDANLQATIEAARYADFINTGLESGTISNARAIAMAESNRMLWAVTPRNAAPPQQQAQDPDLMRLEIVQRIAFDKDVRAAFQKFGPRAKDIEELKNMVNESLKDKWGEVKVAATTTSSGEVNVKLPSANPYIAEEIRRHEEVHRKTNLAGIAKYGQETPTFNKWFYNPKRWAKDEVKAYSVGIKYLEQSLRQLNASR
ncbi:MAG: RHS repeat-associated core domain-containing protein [Acidobacteria bacterium]|nr:RHS repeat-associated core domain-containing protein [Acidobacteriota bacterium]